MTNQRGITMTIRLKNSNCKKRCPDCGRQQLYHDQRFNDYYCLDCGYWQGDKAAKKKIKKYCWSLNNLQPWARDNILKSDKMMEEWKTATLLNGKEVKCKLCVI